MPEDHKPVLSSDDGSGFIREELAKYLNVHRIRHIFGKLYHSQTQGRIERFNRRIKKVYACWCIAALTSKGVRLKRR